MELKKNLLRKEEKSYFRFVLSIIFFVISVSWILLRIRDGQKITLFDWFCSGLFFLNGTIHSIGGFGFQPEALIGKAFILINNETISIKTGVFDKEQNILWTEIKKIEYNLSKFHILRMDGSTLSLDLSKIDYALKNEIRKTVESIAKEKQTI